MTEKKKKLPVLPVLALCLLALLCCYFGIVWLKGEQKQEKAEEIIVNQVEDIRELSWTKGEEMLAFVKEEGTWFVDGNKEFPLKQEEMEALAGTLEHLTAVRRLEGHDGLEVYGLLKPVLSVTVVDGEGRETVLSVGDKTGENYYACLEGRDDIYTISGELINGTDKGLYDLIVPDVFPVIPEEQIEKIVITRDDNEAVYEKAGEKADSERIEELKAAVSGLIIGSSVDFKPSEEEMKEYGLLNPSLILKVIWKEDGGEKEVVLKVGAKKEEEESYYTSMDDSGIISLMDADSLAAFYK